MEKPKIIAFYLPQFHPIPENNEWWGKGFTEWTNVGKARPLFKGHYQPRVPADLGYYDLRMSKVREEQTILAKEAGIEGFCYWHYWFGNGKQLIERPFNEVLDTGKPDFPFCLGWANHSWYAKTWESKGNDKLLIEQLYNDSEEHFNYLLKAFKDTRYIKYDNKPLLIVFDAKSLPGEYMNRLNNMARDNGLDGICFIGISKSESDYSLLRQKGYSYFLPERISNVATSKNIFIRRLYQIKNIFLRRPVNCFTYKEAIPYFTNLLLDSKEDVIPMLIPQWDHSPRSAGKGLILHKSSPEYFKKHIEDVFSILRKKKQRFVFLKSWNEWAEGNYIEPDLKWGKQYINVLREAIDEFINNKGVRI